MYSALELGSEGKGNSESSLVNIKIILTYNKQIILYIYKTVPCKILHSAATKTLIKIIYDDKPGTSTYKCNQNTSRSK